MRAAGGNFGHLQGVLARFPLAKTQILSVFIKEIQRKSQEIWCFLKNAPLVSRSGLTRGAFFKRGGVFPRNTPDSLMKTLISCSSCVFSKTSSHFA